MNSVLVTVDGAKLKSRPPRCDSTLSLFTVGPHPNLRCEIDVFRTYFCADIDRRLDDLLRIAAVVYSADTRVRRGSSKDVFADRWQRDFHVRVPVYDRNFWDQEDVRRGLCDTLTFLTGDRFEFEFGDRQGNDYWPQGVLQFKEQVKDVEHSDCAVLFSGGSDSLAATLEAVAEGKKPTLVSHRPVSIIDHRQTNLVSLLRRRFPQWAFPHVSMWVNRSGGSRPVEFTQRSRSFLFTSLAAVASVLLQTDDIRLCDNGVVSINLPQSGQLYGTFLSRSTHPRYLALAQQLMRRVTGCQGLKIKNTLLFRTKTETLQIIDKSGHPDLLQETVSCAHTEGQTTAQPHCGVCSQCIDRRFAGEAARLTEHDLPSRYAKDIFGDPLKDGEERTRGENYVRFAASLERLSSCERFFESYSELLDCLPEDGDVEKFSQEVFTLFQRHQVAVNRVLEEKISQNGPIIRRGSLLPNCLLRIVCAGEHARDPRDRYVIRLRELLCSTLPPAFRTVKAQKEKHVQDVGESVLKAAGDRLCREGPQLPFGYIATKPDFSDQTPPDPLFIEFKYVAQRSRLNAVITEMTSRVMIYRHQCAAILFIVYDPKRWITDDATFAQPFEQYEKVWVGVSR